MAMCALLLMPSDSVVPALICAETSSSSACAVFSGTESGASACALSSMRRYMFSEIGQASRVSCDHWSTTGCGIGSRLAKT